MSEYIGVRFKEVGKIIYYNTCGEKYQRGDFVLAETNRGLELGEVAFDNRIGDPDNPTPEFTASQQEEQSGRKIVRRATEDDLKRHENNKRISAEAFEICQQKIIEHKLKMKLISVEYTFDTSKILFYFTADGRIDFRDLVKSLAAIFHTRIELRQIGARDEAKFLGGLGECGRILCCRTFLSEFAPVSIKMAKEQGLSLNPTKISGTCGRLMCCLKYEQEAYEELSGLVPKAGAIVDTPEGRGTVADSNVIALTVKVQLDKDVANLFKTFKANEVNVRNERKES